MTFSIEFYLFSVCSKKKETVYLLVVYSKKVYVTQKAFSTIGNHHAVGN